MRLLLALLLCGFCLLITGCSSVPDNGGRFAVAPEQYQVAIDASRSVLDRYGMSIERVDAAYGVVTSQPKRTAGVVTPWDREQSTARQEWEDFVNRQSRVVRIVIEPEEIESVDPAINDLRDAAEAGVPLVGRVEAVVFRQHRAHKRLQSEAIFLTTFAGDPQMQRRHGTSYSVAHERDGKLERRLAAAIEQEMSRSASP